MTTKITRKELFTALLNLEAVKANPLWKEKLEAEIVAIDKKNANRKPTAQQEENEGIKKEIVTILESYPEGLTITQIMKLHSYEFRSNQQCTALCRQLRLDNIIDRKETKKGTLYFFVNEEA